MCWKALIWLVGRLRWSETQRERCGNSACFAAPFIFLLLASKNLCLLQLENETFKCSPTTQLGECSLFIWYGEMWFWTYWWCDGLVWRGKQQQEIEESWTQLFVCCSLCECLTRTTSICLTNVLPHRMRGAEGCLMVLLLERKLKSERRKEASVSFFLFVLMCEMGDSYTLSNPPLHQLPHHYLTSFYYMFHSNLVLVHNICQMKFEKWWEGQESDSAWLLWRVRVTYILPTLPSHHSKWLHLNYYCSTITCSSVTHLWLSVFEKTMFGSTLLVRESWCPLLATRDMFLHNI